MADSIIVNKDLSLADQYEMLIPQVKSLIEPVENLITNLSNFTAVLNDSFDKISWIGFYLFDGKKLYLGPFQGKVACTQIEIGKGVCGTAAQKMQTIIVPDVFKFPGHIFCDSDSKSEIVVPLIKNDKLLGVLDIDSYDYNSFDEIDKKYLEELCDYLATKIFI